MADYDFYVNCYLGDTIPEKQFPRLAAQAAGVLAGYERSYTVSCPGEDSKKFAICAMAETLLAHERREKGLHSASVNDCQEQRPLARQLMGKARIYLDIYRGVK